MRVYLAPPHPLLRSNGFILTTFFLSRARASFVHDSFLCTVPLAEIVDVMVILRRSTWALNPSSLSSSSSRASPPGALSTRQSMPIPQGIQVYPTVKAGNSICISYAIYPLIMSTTPGKNTTISIPTPGKTSGILTPGQLHST